MFEPLKSTACIVAYALSVLFPGNDVFLPRHTVEAAIYTYPGYVLQYNEKFELADWVAYELTAGEVQSKTAKRTDRFYADPFIPTGSATDEDYKKSGWDRGHLAPASDMKFSAEAMKASFYYSNVSPQNPSFNRTLWASLEAMTRYWAVENGAVFVVTGPVLNKDAYPTIGKNEVAVPEYFFKVILDYRLPEKKGIAFIIPNEKPRRPAVSFAVTIDEAEAVTGIDFFHQLPDSEEIPLESQIDISRWPMKEY